METGQGIVTVIVDGGEGDLMCFQSAFRTPHRKITVIGESPVIREAVKKAGIEATVDFAPAGFQPLPESIIIDATKYVKR